MIRALFPRTPEEQIWQEFRSFNWDKQPESVWQFSRQRYIWAKDQWPNVSGNVTTLWTLEDLGLLDKVNPELVQQLREARPLPARLERQFDLKEEEPGDDSPGQPAAPREDPGDAPA